MSVGEAMDIELFERYSSCQPTDMGLLTTNLGEAVGLRAVEVMDLLKRICRMWSPLWGQQKSKSLSENHSCCHASIRLSWYSFRLMYIFPGIEYVMQNHGGSYIDTVLKGVSCWRLLSTSSGSVLSLVPL